MKLILDDRADLVEQIGFDGVHVDAGDVTPAEARRLLGPERIIGTFGGGATGFVPGILDTLADYFSIGPVFATRTKQTSSPPIGMEGVRRLREEAGAAPVLVAIGGITLATAAEASPLEPWWLSPARSSASRTRRPSFAGGWRSWAEQVHDFPGLRSET